MHISAFTYTADLYDFFSPFSVGNTVDAVCEVRGSGADCEVCAVNSAGIRLRLHEHSYRRAIVNSKR